VLNYPTSGRWGVTGAIAATFEAYQAGFIDHVPTTCLDEFTVLTDYLKRFAALPAVAAYKATK
jgi:hypothetical protein